MLYLNSIHEVLIDLKTVAKRSGAGVRLLYCLGSNDSINVFDFNKSRDHVIIHH